MIKALIVEQNNYARKILNVYIFYDLDTIKNCLFGAINIVKNNVKKKWIYIGCEIVFDGPGSWSFGNDFARNVVIFGVDKSSSFYADNHKNDFLCVLCERDTFDVNGSFDAPDKSLVLFLVKQKQNFA